MRKHLSKDEVKESHQFLLQCFKWAVLATIFLNVVRLFVPQEKPQKISITTCSDAKEYLNDATRLLKANTPMTPEWMMTRRGREELQKSRDIVAKAEQLKSELCGASE